MSRTGLRAGSGSGVTPRIRPATNPPDGRRPETAPLPPADVTCPGVPLPTAHPSRRGHPTHERRHPVPVRTPVLHGTMHGDLHVPSAYAPRPATPGCVRSPARPAGTSHARVPAQAAVMSTTHTAEEVPPSRRVLTPTVPDPLTPFPRRDENHAYAHRPSTRPPHPDRPTSSLTCAVEPGRRHPPTPLAQPESPISPHSPPIQTYIVNYSDRRATGSAIPTNTSRALFRRTRKRRIPLVPHARFAAIANS